MTSITKLMCGIILLTVPTIQYGGYFLLQVLSGKHTELALSAFQKSMFRAGHAHAGVLVLLSLLAQILVDYAALSKWLEWIVRIGFPLAAVFISGGFFASAVGKGIEEPTKNIWLLYLGISILFISLILLGIGLLKNR
jgi:hypothetical protein